MWLKMKKKVQKIPVSPICKECGFSIVRYQKFFMHTDGTILCRTCFKKLKKRGDIA